MADLPQVALETAQLAQRQVDVGKLLTEFLVQFLLEVARADVVDHRRLTPPPRQPFFNHHQPSPPPAPVQPLFSR